MNQARTATRFELPLAAPSRLGEALPRPVYTIHIPGVLLVTGLVTWVAGNETAMAIAGFIGGGIGAYMLWDWLFREGPTRLSTILAIALLLGYGLGTANTWLTLPTGGLTIAQVMGGDETVYAHGIAAVMMVSAPLCLLGELYERPVFGNEFRLPLDQRTYLFIIVGTLAVVVAFFMHAIGFQGQEVAAGGQVSVAGSLVSWMFPPLTALTIAVFLVVRGALVKPLMGLCTLVLCVLIMAIGRRNMIYTAMLVIFTLRLTGYRLKGTFLRKAFLIGGLGFFLAVGVTVFMLLRLAGFQAHKSNVPLGKRIQIALSWVEDGSALSRATEANRTNAQRRTFVLGFFADVLDASMRRTPALGKDFVGYTSQAIPRVFNPNKDASFGEEGLADGQFGLTYRDAANSILTNGATDFGPVGLIAYPLLLIVFFRFCIGVLVRLLPPLAASFLALGIVFTLLQTENAIEFYLNTIRNVIIFAFVLFVFARLPTFGMRTR